MQQQTCGPLYLEGLLKYAGDDPEKVRLFAAGFITGQAEKVYLGACMAAMFRPSRQHWVMVWEIAQEIGHRYGLNACYLRGDPDDDEPEIWVYQPTATALIDLLITRRGACQPRSGEWHSIRGILCGVPASEIDREFHRRKGYGEPCDKTTYLR